MQTPGKTPNSEAAQDPQLAGKMKSPAVVLKNKRNLRLTPVRDNNNKNIKRKLPLISFGASESFEDAFTESLCVKQLAKCIVLCYIM